MKKLLTAVFITFSVTALHAEDGVDTYNTFCMACHGTGIGPMAGDKTAWQPRMDAKGGVEGLFESAKVGLNAMPPKGTCMSCTDEQLKAAIVYMTTFN